jgi:single-strand DNA-binding protein
MNLIHIAGRLGADPETRFTASGQKVTSFRVAVNVRKAGKEETIWYRVTIWGDRFDKMVSYLKKGSAVIIAGTLQKPEIYTDKEGRPQISLEITAEIIQFSPFGKEDRSDEGGASYGQQQQQSYGRPAPAAPAHQEYDYSPSPSSGYRFDQVGGATHHQEEEENMPF